MMEVVVNKHQLDRNCNTDNIPREYCKEGTVLFSGHYSAVFNAILLLGGIDPA